MAAVRVIGGELGSRRLRAPAGRATRPSSDRLRQALFDVLGPGVAEGPFLDGFAGSGAVGIEAFSRGARPVVWIESGRAAARALRRNLEALQLSRDAAMLLERGFEAGVKAAAKLAPVAAVRRSGALPQAADGGGAFGGAAGRRARDPGGAARGRAAGDGGRGSAAAGAAARGGRQRAGVLPRRAAPWGNLIFRPPSRGWARRGRGPRRTRL
jgi:hypothetical protein